MLCKNFLVIKSSYIFLRRKLVMLTELLYKVGRIIIGGYARLMLKMDVHWHDVPPQGPVLYAANHNFVS